MNQGVPFKTVLALLEEHGWKLLRIVKPFHVFSKRGRSPIVVQVHNKHVRSDDVERIQRAIAEDQAQGGSRSEQGL